MHLYDFCRSSAAYRVRIALNLKGVRYAQLPVNLTKNGGEHHAPSYRAVNPHQRVPALQLDDGEIITQSMAILEYLEETIPRPALLPSGPVARARVRALSQMIVSDIHPLNNLVTMNYLRDLGGLDSGIRHGWYGHWIREGFRAVEQMIEGGEFCMGGAVSIADLCLIPQVSNARRHEVDIAEFPKIVAIEKHCLSLPAFAAARPEAQPDFEAH